MSTREADRQTIINALHVAADCYRREERAVLILRTPGDDDYAVAAQRLADQFGRQAADCCRIVDEMENAAS